MSFLGFTNSEKYHRTEVRVTLERESGGLLMKWSVTIRSLSFLHSL